MKTRLSGLAEAKRPREIMMDLSLTDSAINRLG